MISDHDSTQMKNILKLEEFFMFFFSIYLFSLLPYAWYWYPVLILLPDISMLGYLIDNKKGANLYNLFHHKGLAFIIYLIGIFFNNSILALAGVILFGHSSMDRIFGYGLKYKDSFHHTHLGTVGRKKV